MTDDQATTELPDEWLTTITFSTTYIRLPEEVAIVVGYDFQQSHHCMECGDRVGAATMANHARWHAGLPPKPKAAKDTNGRRPAVEP
jgi:hypothetical protein